MKKQIVTLLIVNIILSSFLFSQSQKNSKSNKPVSVEKEIKKESAKPLITFIELGSVNCIPCKMMQPVMKAIENKYGDQVKVVFYDVWTAEQQKYAREYKIRVIPTQVFLDGNGKEILRHEGFFPEKEIDAFLQSKGLKPKSADKG